MQRDWHTQTYILYAMSAAVKDVTLEMYRFDNVCVLLERDNVLVKYLNEYDDSPYIFKFKCLHYVFKYLWRIWYLFSKPYACIIQ